MTGAGLLGGGLVGQVSARGSWQLVLKETRGVELEYKVDTMGGQGSALKEPVDVDESAHQINHTGEIMGTLNDSTHVWEHDDEAGVIDYIERSCVALC
ncbi:hypothetical protein [Natrinema pellirubrum]|uniref:hypothetical protein n=1 Tax=Natrinema pellirubrum TaxID=69525 RepID=UPI001268A563|nr:hypothetical protein [Natrinema pellirubrum]